MSTPPRTPRLPARAAADGDRYVWLGVLWLVMLAGGFLALVMTILPIMNLPVLAGIVAFIGLNVCGHFVLGRWVARRIAATTPPPESDLE